MKGVGRVTVPLRRETVGGVDWTLSPLPSLLHQTDPGSLLTPVGPRVPYRTLIGTLSRSPGPSRPGSIRSTVPPVYTTLDPGQVEMER